MNALKKQLKNDIENYIIKDNKKIETVFIGGGTPSTIKAFEYKEIFEIIKPYLEKNAEITTEANPNSASFDWLKGMHDLGVNRVSFGVQSFNSEKLYESERGIKPSQDELNGEVGCVIDFIKSRGSGSIVKEWSNVAIHGMYWVVKCTFENEAEWFYVQNRIGFPPKTAPEARLQTPNTQRRRWNPLSGTPAA